MSQEKSSRGGRMLSEGWVTASEHGIHVEVDIRKRICQ
jgi:hypothetical protein